MENITHYRYERDYGFEINRRDFKIVLREFKTIRETPCGYWIQLYRGKEKFIIKEAFNSYAYKSKIMAFNNFRERTKKAAYYSLQNMNNANAFLSLCKDFKVE